MYIVLCTLKGCCVVFVWDERKNKSNRKKHGISFEEAVCVFNDEKLLEIYDPEHSNTDEDRWYALGSIGILIVVVFTIRNDSIRIISARKATTGEKNEYYKDYDLR